MEPRQVTGVAELGAVAADPLVRWAAQELAAREVTAPTAVAVPASGAARDTGNAVDADDESVEGTRGARDAEPTRAWRLGDAVAVAGPDLCRHDRVVVAGPPHELARLVPLAVAAVGTTYRLLGAADVVSALARRGRVVPLGSFGWMDTDAPPPTRLSPESVDWLAPHDDAAVSELLGSASPGSYAWPGQRGVQRWAGRRDPDGRLACVAAEAWSAPEVGFCAGVATRPDRRGRGHAADVCWFVLDALVRRYGRAALMVDADNEPAIRLYRRLGLRYRTVTAAALRPGAG